MSNFISNKFCKSNRNFLSLTEPFNEKLMQCNREHELDGTPHNEKTLCERHNSLVNLGLEFSHILAFTQLA